MRKLLALVLVAACASDDMTALAPPSDFGGHGTDAFGARPGDPARVAELTARAKRLIKPGSVMQIEPRLGVPTFVWAKQPLQASSRARWVTANVAHPEVLAARAALTQYAPLYGLTADDIAFAETAHVDVPKAGPSIVKLRQRVGGIEVFREELNVLLDENLDAIALGGYISSSQTPPARPGAMDFALASAQGTALVLKRASKLPIEATQIAPIARADGYEYFDVLPAAGVVLGEPIRAKPVYFRLPEGLEAAYYVEVIAYTGAGNPDEISEVGGGKTLEGNAFVISAATGQLLWKKDLIAEDFTYRVWADPTTKLPQDTPAGNAPHPKLTPVPDGFQAPFVAPSDVTLNSFPYSNDDPWLPPGATETNGNNVDAYLNLLSPDGYGNPTTTTPADPAVADYRAQITGADAFLHTHDPAANVGLAEGRQGSIQQLFYNINFLHDWYYDAGFNEAAFNAQKNNFGRGGLGNDDIKAQAQDFQSFSNANMLTPADGTRPRMRMYVFPSPANHLAGITPPTVAGKFRMGISMSGAQSYDITADVVRATFSNTPTACTLTNPNDLAGKIALFDFDNTDGVGCAFSTRINRIQTGTTAAGILMSYLQTNPTVVANITGYVLANTKPVATISWNTKELIQTELTAGNAVNMRMFRAPDFDGTVDNQIVFHEWMHYSSNRLVGNATGLTSLQGVGMGEGWGDFNALMLTVRPDDISTPSNATWNGAYALATHALGGVPFDGVTPNNNFYFGIRRYPYSTNLAINPLTFKHIQDGVALPVGPPVAFGADGASNSEVHNTGEVWTSMLWECYAGILRDTLGPTPRLTFQQAQTNMKRYVIGGLKLTPVAPTFTEARDGVLATALATDPADYLACKAGFAKRGAGTHAVAPDRNSADNTTVVEDFATDADLAIDAVTLDDTLGSCDSDGVVDTGEYGKLAVTVRNIGFAPLTGTTATVATSSAGIWFPSGATLTFPTIAPGATATVSLRIAVPPGLAGVQQADFTVTVDDAQIAAPVSRLASFRLNTDDIPASSAIDTVEAAATPWTASAGSFAGNAPFARVALTALDHEWHVADPGVASDERLTSPVFTVDGSGSVNVQFDHAWSFEFDGGGNYDGGVVELSVNGGAFAAFATPDYNGTILNYTGTLNPLAGRAAFVQTGSGHASLTVAVAPGSTIQVRFRAGSDSSLGAGGWNIDNIAFSGVVETPFATLVAEAGTCDEVPTSADLAITKTNGTTSVTAGAQTTYTIVARNNGPDDIIGATVIDTFPSELTGCTWTCAGSCTASGTGNIADSITLAANGTATYVATCTVSTTSPAGTVSNTATIANPGPVTDPDPANNSATDTDVLVHLPAHLRGTKTVAGTFSTGGTVMYTVILTNDGTGAQFDNAGAEFTDAMPAGLAFVSAAATSGTATEAGGTVSWNGSVAAGSSVTITVVATIAAPAGTTISNQGTFHYDGDGNGSNESSGVTDAFPCN